MLRAFRSGAGVAAGIPYWRLAAVYFAYFAFVGAFSPFFGLYLQSLGAAPWEIGTLNAEMQLVRTVAPNFWAWLVDMRGHRERWLRATLVLGAVAWSMLLWTHDLAALSWVLALSVFFTSAAMPLVESATLSHLRERLSRYGAIRLWGSIGFIAAVLGVGRLLERWPLAALPAIVLATLGLSLAVAFTVPAAPQTRAARGESVWPLLRRPDIALFFGACFLMSVAHGPLYAFYSIHLAAHGYSTTLVGAMWSIGVVAEILVFMGMTALLARFGAMTVLRWSFAAAVIRFAIIGWSADSVAALVFAQILHGATFGAYHAAALALVHRWFEGGRHVRGQALYLSLSFGAGGMVGGLASGFAWESIGPAWTFTAASVAAAAGLLLLVPRARIPGLSWSRSS